MKSRIFFLILMSFVQLLSADFKVGVIDEQMIIDKSQKGEHLMSRLTKEVEQKQAEIDSIKDSIRKAEQNKVIAGEQKKIELDTEITRLKVQLEVEGKMSSESIGKRQLLFRQILVDEINDTIEIIGKEEGFDLIIRKHVPLPRGREVDMLPLVYFAKEGVDITQSVLDYMDTKFRQESQKQVEK